MKKRFAIVSLVLLAATSAFAADGAALFKSLNCSMCHGPNGKGETPMGKSLKLRDLGSPEVQKQTDAELKTIIEDGRNKMPPFKGRLAAGDAEALVAFLRTLKR